MFITGVVGAGVATVILPHFASHFAHNRGVEGRQDLSFYLFFGAAIMIPLGLFLFVIAEDLIRLVFGGSLDNDGIKTVARVMAFGIIQVPFFTNYILLIKFANAGREIGVILISAIIGLMLNVGLNLFFMRLIGVSGLALATSLSMFITVLVLILLTYRKGNMGVIDVLRLTLLLLLYLTTIICLHYASYAGVIVAGLAIVLLLLEHLGPGRMLFPKVSNKMSACK
jgi:putative peptidoglycan lipid II flippase